MKFSYSWLKELSGTNLKPRELAERLTMHSFEVERVEQAGKDTILHIDVLPNRAHDCLAHQGVAREIAVLSGKRASFAAEAAAWLKKITPLSPKVLRVNIADKDFGPRYLGVVIEGLTVKPSPKAIQERLGTLGVKVINNLVDITNYVMLETGMPLHAFDLDRIQGRMMTVRSARMREALTTLDGVMRLVPADTLIIEDAEGLVDLAGAMGGATSAVSEATTRIFLQAAVFDAARIYRLTRALNFRTEASVRYAAGLSPALAEAGLWRAAELLEAEGGKVSGKLDIYPTPQAPTEILLNAQYAQRLLGADVSDREIRDILTRVGCRIGSKPKTQKYIAVVPPAVRLDLKTPEDLIEEVGRVIGYEKIPPMMPQSTLVPAAPEEEVIFADRIRDALQGGGLSEVYNYSLINLTPYGQTEAAQALTLENPMSDRRNHLRTSLVPGLLRNAVENLRFFDNVRLFEVGKIFKSNIENFISSEVERQTSKTQIKNKKEQNARTLYPVDERRSVGGIVARKGKSEDIFFELKGILAGLCEGFGVGEVWFDNYRATSAPTTIAAVWDEARTAEIKIGDREVGFLGVLRGAEKFSAAAFELDMQALMESAREEREYRPVPKYPAVTRDISLLVTASVRIADIENTVENSGAKYIQDVDLFDTYEGDEFGEGRQSLAFHIIYQADDHTLTDEEVNTEHRKVERALKETLGAEVR